jgi:hypothetical protein
MWYVATLLETVDGIPGGTIHNVPRTTALVQQQELTLVGVMIDTSKEHIILYLPSDFGWQYHFGCLCCCLNDVYRIGIMLFSFHGGGWAPMQVTVLRPWQTKIPSKVLVVNELIGRIVPIMKCGQRIQFGCLKSLRQ